MIATLSRVARTRLASIGLLAVLVCLPRTAEAKRPPGYVPEDRTWFSYAARYTHPQKAGISLMVMRAEETDLGTISGWFIQAEPGLGGGKLSAGYGALRPSEHVWVPPIFGLGVKGSVLRTWGTPHEAQPRQTFLGPEVDFTLRYLKGSAGYLWRADGAGGPSGLFTWGVGVGF